MQVCEGAHAGLVAATHPRAFAPGAPGMQRSAPLQKIRSPQSKSVVQRLCGESLGGESVASVRTSDASGAGEGFPHAVRNEPRRRTDRTSRRRMGATYTLSHPRRRDSRRGMRASGLVRCCSNEFERGRVRIANGVLWRNTNPPRRVCIEGGAYGHEPIESISRRPAPSNRRCPEPGPPRSSSTRSSPAPRGCRGRPRCRRSEPGSSSCRRRSPGSGCRRGRR